uniref:Uncharacterized protein n=1 Tax=Kwoniella bestiolae CBS 10118 TaxID=1296100 RepID=A0A1B9GGS5_9TREE|nr:hypothetical protein I302_01769 [Kwoniella bestiolae CBS 10118]OCF30250.1 hypothetical protein I302_01769 [Kwoniella bestiolae CBS 10118]
MSTYIDFHDCSVRTIAHLESQINSQEDPSYILAKVDILRDKSQYNQEWGPTYYSEKLANLWYPTRNPGWLTKDEREQAYRDTMNPLTDSPRSHVNQFASVINDIKHDLDCCTPRQSDYVDLRGMDRYDPQTPGEAFVDSMLWEDLPTLLEIAGTWNENIERYRLQWEWEKNRSCWRSSLCPP